MRPRVLYLDVDGVLLGRDPRTQSIAIAPHAAALLEYALPRASCKWLSTHSASGSSDNVLAYLQPFSIEPRLHALFARVDAVAWGTLKTEAIDFSADFYWLDDAPLQAELRKLQQENASDRWLHTDTRHRWHDLGDALTFLQEQW